MAVTFNAKSKKYVADWRLPGGQRKRRFFSTKGEALAAEAAERLRNPRGRNLPPASALTFKAFAEVWIAERGAGLNPVAGATVTHYKTCLDRLYPFLGGRSLRSIDRLDWRAALTKLGETLAPGTLSVTRSVGRYVFRSALAEGLIHADPTVGTARSTVAPRRVKVKAITLDEAAAVLSRAADADARAAIALGLLAGLRSSEIIGLRWQDLDLDGKLLRVEGSVSREDLVKQTKTAAGTRVVPIASGLNDALLAVERAGSFVVRGELDRDSKENIGALQSWLFYVVSHAAEAAGVKAGPHTLRHTWASALVAAGTSLAHVAKWGGWRDLSFVYRTYGAWLPPENSAPLEALSTTLSQVSTTVHLLSNRTANRTPRRGRANNTIV